MLRKEDEVEVLLSLQFPSPRDELPLIVKWIDNVETGTRLGGGGGRRGGGEGGRRGRVERKKKVTWDSIR